MHLSDYLSIDIDIYDYTCQIHLSQNLYDLLKHSRGLEEWELFVTCLRLVFFHLLST